MKSTVCWCITVSCLLAACTAVIADPPAGQTDIQPAVSTLLQQATLAYRQMHSYQHTAELLDRNAQGAVTEDRAYTFALELPNKFCYRSDDNGTDAVVCNGKLFTDFNSTARDFIRYTAPASYTQVDLVYGINFEGVASYMIALMLQGNVLADPELRLGLEKADAPKIVTDNGVQYQMISFPLKAGEPPIQLYFDISTHLLHKSLMKTDGKGENAEIIENVKINQPIQPSLFQYTPPNGARWVT